MTEFFGIFEEDIAVKRERAKARKLKASQWWKRKLATGTCYYCGQFFIPAELTMDHVIPLIRGGKSERFNLVPCCKECNKKKKSLLPTEWEAYMRRLT